MDLDLTRIKNTLTWPQIDSRVQVGYRAPHTFFENYKLVSSEGLVRPVGNSTLFTTAAIQRLETLYDIGGPLPNQNIMVYQPCIRMQYIDTVKQGSGTSFVNFAVIHFNAQEHDFLRLTRLLQQLMINYGANPKDVVAKNKTEAEKWGNREFMKTTLAFYVADHQFAEVIFMHDYPHCGHKTNIIEVGMGLERVKYLLNPQMPYYREFSNLYDGYDFDAVTNVIDCVKTFVLICGEGVVPGYKSHKYRLRQLSKKLVALPLFSVLDIEYIAKVSYEYWGRYGIKFIRPIADSYAVLAKENERNLHCLELSDAEQTEGFKINLDVNLPDTEFKKRLNKLIYDNRLQKGRE